MENNNDYAKYWYDERERCEQLSKQLDQLKAENEQLKNFHINLVGVKECEIRELAELKAENEELREIMHKDCCTHYVLGECSQEHHNNCVGKNQCIKDLEQENEKLKVYKSITPLKVKMLVKTLDEIKEIAESCGWNFGSEILYKRIEQILQKISEVEDGTR